MRLRTIAPVLLFVVALFAPSLAGQEAAAPQPLVTLRFDDLAALRAQLPATRLGQLGALPEVAAAWATLTAALARESAHTAAVVDAAAARQIDVHRWFRVQAATCLMHRARASLDWDSLNGVLLAYLPQAERGWGGPPLSVFAVRCAPKAEGPAALQFESSVRAIERSEWLEPVAEGKFDGTPAQAFKLGAPNGGERDYGWSQAEGLWFVHMPGQFVYGTGAAQDCVGAVPTLASAAAGCEFTIAFNGSVAAPVGAPPEIAAYGADAPHALSWHARFAGDLVLDELAVSFAAEATARLEALFRTGALPRQGLPAGAILQLRAALEPKHTLDLLATHWDGLLPRDVDTNVVAAALDGGIALAVAAPKGGVVPRLFATIGVADVAAARALMARLCRGLDTKEQPLGDATMIILSLPGLPAALQPAFCFGDGCLHVAESPASLRALLAAQADDAAAPFDDAPQLPADTAALPGFELRFDAAALYRAFRDTWLPLFELQARTRLAPADPARQPLLTRDDLPTADAVAEALGRGRGVLRRDGDRIVLTQAGTLGGPLLAALAMTYAPMLHTLLWRDSLVSTLEHQCGEHQLGVAWQALSAFRQTNGRWPKDLAELFVAGHLADDALLLPGDDGSEVVTIPGNPPRTARSSFRYFAEPIAAGGLDGGRKALLIQLQTRRYGRLVLDDAGQLPGLDDDTNRMPIDAFGK